ncbi:MAG: bifunctional nuclease family protein [Deltaproteobacteria bacterium]|nr:bifunctional nuclease family protein [Deltaproteobacteria bacterium]
MDYLDFIPIREIYIKTEKETGNLLILKEHGQAEASLVMFVGEPEFIAIAKEKGLLQTPRPLTHELYLSILGQTEVELLQVSIDEVRDQTYLAQVHYRIGVEEYSADSRPSDAIALALHQKIPILVHPGLLKKPLSSDQLDTLKDFIKSVKF